MRIYGNGANVYGTPEQMVKTIEDLKRQVEELEQDNKIQRASVNLLKDVLHNAEQEVKKQIDQLTAMRGALEFYACNGTYKAIEIRTGNGGYSDPPIVIDEGERAREALNKLEGK